MIYSLQGILLKKTSQFAVIDCHGVAFKVFISERTRAQLSHIGEEVKIFTFLSVKENALDFFGFLDESSLRFFELLCMVNGVGPRTALAVMDVDSVDRITAAILGKRPDLLLRAPGIGKKTAERIVLELQSKLEMEGTGSITGRMTLEVEVEDALMGLGYSRHDARQAVQSVKKAETTFEETLRAALRLLGGK